jgi:hypothetical protein
MDIPCANLPLPSPYEDDEDRLWWNKFYERVCVNEFLGLATNARNGTGCRFGSRLKGSYNVVFIIVFQDGVEWAAKMPKLAEKEDNSRMISELSTLRFIADIDTVKAPRVHGFALDVNNPSKTPYILMDKVEGVPFCQALRNGLSKQGVHETLRQLAMVRRALAEHPFEEIGSLTIISRKTYDYAVDAQISVWNVFDFLKNYKCRSGPFLTSLEYYANLLHISWSDAQYERLEPDKVEERWRVHCYLGSVLCSFVGKETGEFFLAHTDLDAQNILVDDNGSITGIIDWEFASTLPFRAAEHYPKLLSSEKNFVKYTNGVFSDPQAEFYEWRRFYAEQFIGDAKMEDYLDNIDAITAFENILRDNSKATMKNLVKTCKFIDSNSTFKKIGIEFPWKSPTTKGKARLGVSNGRSASIPNEKSEAGIQAEANLQITEVTGRKDVQALQPGGKQETVLFGVQTDPPHDILPPDHDAVDEIRLMGSTPSKLGPTLPFPVFDSSELTPSQTQTPHKYQIPPRPSILNLCSPRRKPVSKKGTSTSTFDEKSRTDRPPESQMVSHYVPLMHRIWWKTPHEKKILKEKDDLALKFTIDGV